MSFSMFSPLRTPDVIKAKKYKFSSPRKIISDEESVTSDMTKDLRKMAMNVSSKLKRAPDITPTSSDNELFQSQSKLKKKTSNKTPNKTVQDTGSGSESGILDSSSESDSDNKVHKPKSSPYSSSGSDSDKETRKQNSSPQKKVNKNSQNSGSDSESSVLDSSSDSNNDHINRLPKSSPKIKVKKNLLNSDSERSGLNSNLDSERHSIKQKHKSPVKQKEIKSKSSPQMKKVDKNSRSDSESSVLDSSLDSDSDHKTPKPPAKQNKRKSAVSFQGSLLDDNSDADDFSDRTVETKSSKKSFRENESESQPVTKRSRDSSDSSDSDQGATPAKKSKVQDSPKKTTNSNSAKKTPRDSVQLSYKIPDNFTIDKSEQYLTKSDVKGKQLWLIVAPGDFDISTLDKQKINLDGDSIVTSQIDDIDRQYEVYAKLYPENYSSSYNCVTAKSEGSEAFVVDAEMQGQIRIMNWIPSMPVVKLVNTQPTKHTVPDHLKPCWQPFGSEVPVRQDEELRVDQKQKKKKKKKDKKNTD